MKKITVEDLINSLKRFNPDDQVFVANDEELNVVSWGFEVMEFEDRGLVIFPTTGEEIEEE